MVVSGNKDAEMLYNRKKEKEKFIAPLDDRAIVHCSMANGVQAQVVQSNYFNKNRGCVLSTAIAEFWAIVRGKLKLPLW